MKKTFTLAFTVTVLLALAATQAQAFCLWWMEPCDGGPCFWCW